MLEEVNKLNTKPRNIAELTVALQAIWDNLSEKNNVQVCLELLHMTSGLYAS